MIRAPVDQNVPSEEQKKRLEQDEKEKAAKMLASPYCRVLTRLLDSPLSLHATQNRMP
jgi:hypothetical protein